MKTREEIRATTPRIPRPADYRYGTKLKEWEPAETQLSRDEFIRQVQPMHDKIVVQLLNEPQDGNIVLTDAKPLIGGCRKARVLKIGPGRWIPGEWWKVPDSQVADAVGRLDSPDGDRPYWSTNGSYWDWIPGYRRPVDVLPGQIVLIGNWVDLEIEDIALCAEGDVRSIWQN